MNTELIEKGENGIISDRMDNIKKDDDDGDSESDDDLDEDGNIHSKSKKLFNISKSIHSLTNERRSQRSSKKGNERSTNEMMQQIMQQNEKPGSVFDISIIPNCQSFYMRVMHDDQTLISTDKRLYFKLTHLNCQMESEKLEAATISFFTNTKTLYHWSIYHGVCFNRPQSKPSNLLLPCVLRDENLNENSNFLIDSDDIMVFWMVTRCATKRCDCLIINSKSKQVEIIGDFGGIKRPSAQYLSSRIPMMNITLDLNEVAKIAHQYLESNFFYYNPERFPLIHMNTKNFKAIIKKSLMEQDSTEDDTLLSSTGDDELQYLKNKRKNVKANIETAPAKKSQTMSLIIQMHKKLSKKLK